jgi:hypothetical protein
MRRLPHAAMRLQEGSSTALGLSVEMGPERVKTFHHTLRKRAGLFPVDVGIGLYVQ